MIDRDIVQHLVTFIAFPARFNFSPFSGMLVVETQAPESRVAWLAGRFTRGPRSKNRSCVFYGIPCPVFNPLERATPAACVRSENWRIFRWIHAQVMPD